MAYPSDIPFLGVLSCPVPVQVRTATQTHRETYPDLAVPHASVRTSARIKSLTGEYTCNRLDLALLVYLRVAYVPAEGLFQNVGLAIRQILFRDGDQHFALGCSERQLSTYMYICRERNYVRL